MLSYPVRIVPEGEGSVRLTFPDLPEAVVFGTDEDDAFAQATPVLETVLDSYLLAGRAIPAPSDICGAPVVTTMRFNILDAERAE